MARQSGLVVSYPHPFGVASGLSRCVFVMAATIVMCGLIGPTRAKRNVDDYFTPAELEHVEKKIAPCPPGPYTPPPGFPKPMPHVRIDLAIPPRERWNKIIDWTAEYHGWEHSFQYVRNYYEAVFPMLKRPLISEVIEIARKSLQGDMLEELEGAIERMNRYQPPNAKNFTLNEMLALNVVYELVAGCTSIVASDHEDRMWHGRNLDWPLPPNVRFTNLTYLVEWVNTTNGNDVIFRAVHNAGFVGANTGIKAHGWSLSMDERRMPNKSRTLMENILNMDFGHALPVTWLMRDALVSNQTFKEAIKTLSEVKVAAADYLIVAGTKNPEGAVITRSWNTSQLWLIPNGPKPWYLVQTNYDHWEPVPPVDNRRGLAEQSLNEVGQLKMGIDTMKFVLGTQGNATTRGVLNADTVFSVIMSADLDYMEGWLWQ